ncbi:MAG: hypothetical protein ACTHWA_11655 [Arachnia sp.]
MQTMDTMVWLAAGYGLLLIAVAWGIDLAARRAAQRTTHWRSGAFSYHEDNDAWLCPEDQWLWPQSFDPENRVMRYRASPQVCNACPVKDTCTTSHTGREVSRNVDPWPSSEAERFHRGIACSVTVLAILWPATTFLTATNTTERLILAAVVVVVAVASGPLWSHLRRTRADFPVHVPVVELDETVAHMEVLARSITTRRATYGSDEDRTSPATPLPTPRVRYTSEARSRTKETHQPGFPVRQGPGTRSNP